MSWLLFVLGLAILVLLVPFSVQLHIETEGELRVDALTRWGGLRLGTWCPRAPSGGPKTKKISRPREDRARRGRRVSWYKLRALLTSDDFVASLGRWLGRLLRVLAPSDVRIRLRLGTGDPYETARVWTALAPLLVVLGQGTSADLDVEPDFLDSSFALQLRAAFRIVPLVLLATSLGYFFTPAPWRALGSYAQA